MRGRPALTALATLVLLGLSPGVVGAEAEDEELTLQTPLEINVDRDPEPEIIRVREITCYSDSGETAPPCEGEFPNRDLQIELVNRCHGVERSTPLLVRSENFVTVAEAVELDGRRGREFIVGAASGASGRNGQMVVGRVRDTGDGCPRFRRVLTLGPYTPRTRKPRRASYHATGFVIARSLRRDFPGRELVVRQPWYRSNDGGCCPTYLSSAYYRSKNGRYVRYRTRVERLSRDR
ncbi:hypothetical protein [Paraconexibacter sp.]|uniref:hypothetical protein n=1 Tax=Paraconexibacter sp. TaxID=2949640 RepID=UPI003566328B